MVSNALDTLGLPKGSAVAIDMPMTVTSIVIYLAIVLAGYVVVSIADSFVPKEIVTRLNIANAKAIFTQVIFPASKLFSSRDTNIMFGFTALVDKG